VETPDIIVGHKSRLHFGLAGRLAIAAESRIKPGGPYFGTNNDFHFLFIDESYDAQRLANMGRLDFPSHSNFKSLICIFDVLIYN